jgi:ribonuclease HI
MEEDNMAVKEYRVYTDGACQNNQAPGGQPGGWGVAFVDGPHFSGFDPKTTNNRMELTAAIEALKHTEPGSFVRIHSDSAYVINAFLQNWFAGWERRGWRNAKGQPVENQDLWRMLKELADARHVEWIKVRGHAGDHYNEIADQLAVGAIREAIGQNR